MTRILAVARDSFRKMPDDEHMVMADHAFCEGLRDPGVAALLTSQASNSGARAIRIDAESIAVNSKQIESKRCSKSSKNPC